MRPSFIPRLFSAFLVMQKVDQGNSVSDEGFVYRRVMVHPMMGRELLCRAVYRLESLQTSLSPPRQREAVLRVKMGSGPKIV
jgi:hypothetical protein